VIAQDPVGKGMQPVEKFVEYHINQSALRAVVVEE
jgi:hypothetical protein